MNDAERVRRAALALPLGTQVDLIAMCNARRVDPEGIAALRARGLMRHDHGHLLTLDALRLAAALDEERRRGGPLGERLGTGRNPRFAS